VVEIIKQQFSYAFLENPYPGAPQFALHNVAPGSLNINSLNIAILRAMHGKLPILGIRVGNFAYLTDVNFIPHETIEKLKNLDVLVLDALHHREHHSHFNITQAIEQAETIGAKKTYFTHISHYMGLAAEVEKTLPTNMHLAFDGQQFEF
jgi:phosphoribosyl 1,2-cyclic phosphate phosphodiesterase